MLEEKFHLTAWPHNILYVFQTKCFIKQVIIILLKCPNMYPFNQELSHCVHYTPGFIIKGNPLCCCQFTGCKIHRGIFLGGVGVIFGSGILEVIDLILPPLFNLYLLKSRYQISPRFTLKSWPWEIWDTGSRLPVLVHSCHLESGGIPPGN